MALQTLSYFTTISINGYFLTYKPTAQFISNGTTCMGVITIGQETDFLVDQTPTYHRIKIDQNNYLTYIPNSVNLPEDVKKYVGATAPGFFTTTNVESKFYFVPAIGPAVQSTIDLNLTVTGIYSCVTSTSYFFSTFGNLLILESNNGYPMDMNIVTLYNTYGGAGSGVPVDPSGNQTLTTPYNIADFTATPLGPVLGAEGTGVLMPGFSRSNAFTVSVPGKQMRYMPYGNIITPDVSQSAIGSRGLFGNGAVLSVSGSVGFFGTSIAITDSINSFAISSPDVGPAGYIEIYEPAFVPILLQTITSPAGETTGESLMFNTDGSVFVFNSRDATDSRIAIYLMTAPGTWTPIPTQLPSVAGDITLANNMSRLGITKDGRTIVCSTYPNKKVLIYEDISVPGDWSSFHVNDITSLITNTHSRAVAISPEGTWVWVIVTDNGVNSEFALFKRHAYNNWTKIYEGALLGPYPGNNASIIKTGYNGLFTIVADDSLIAADPGCNGLASIARLSSSSLIYVRITGTPLTNPATAIQCNSNMSLITVVDNTNQITNIGRISSIVQAPVTQTMQAPITNLTSCTFADSNFGSIGFFGEPSTGTVYIVTTSNNPITTLFGSASFLFKNFNTDNTILSLESTDAPAPVTSNVNPGTPSITDLGAPAARWKDIYYSGSLYLPSKTVDSAFASGSGTVSIISVPAGTSVNLLSNPFEWSRSGNTVNVIGKIAYDTPILAVGNAALQIEFDSALPDPPLHNISFGQVITSAGGLLPTSYGIYVKYVDSTHIGIYTTDATGVEIPFGCGTLDVAPPILGVAGEFQFNFSYQVALS